MSKIRVADYIANFVANQLKVNSIFTVTGGGAMFLNDAFGNHKDIEAIYNNHEQASAMAAVGYAKYSMGFGVACVTTGCGGTNAITGVLDAWQDSTPVFFVSGQVKRKETTYNSQVSMRQYGVQEADIVAIVEPITKYSVMVNEANDIAYHLEKAAYIGENGRPGPVWIDVPLDVQGAWVNEEDLKHFHPEGELQVRAEPNEESMIELQGLIQEAKRPVVIAGNGIRLSSTQNQFVDFIEKYRLPTTFSYLSIDLLPSSHELAVGRLGTKGDRAGNFAVQNADLVIVLGSRLSVALTGFEYELFAREAKIVVVDIDAEEHRKNTVNIDLMIEADLRDFFFKVVNLFYNGSDEWVAKCKHWRNIWPVYQSEYATEENINMYEFIHGLESSMKEDSTVVSDAGSAYYVTSQALKIAQQQRYITSGAQADMGYTIPAAIGACIAKNKQEVLGITGDGSFQMNIQELQTIVHNNLPIKLFVWNNDGYLSIKTTQSKFFERRFAGTGPESGVSCPSFEKIANAYGIHYVKAETPAELSQALNETYAINGPVICEIICPETQAVVPAVSSLKREDGSMVSKPIEDMYPFLDRETFYQEMLVKPVEEK